MNCFVQILALVSLATSLEGSPHYDDIVCESQLYSLDAALEKRELWALNSKSLFQCEHKFGRKYSVDLCTYFRYVIFCLICAGTKLIDCIQLSYHFGGDLARERVLKKDFSSILNIARF